MRILTLFSGILMILVGAFCFVNPGQTFLSVAFVIGLVMVINGLIHTGAYIAGRGLYNRGDNNGWILTDALISLVLGIMILTNQLAAEAAVGMVMGLWVLVSGILRVESATHINRIKKPKNYMSAMITGVATVFIGLFCFINPLVAWLTTVVLAGIFLVIQGINVIELGINMPHEKKPYVKIYNRKRNMVKITDEEETPEKIAERLREKEKREIEKELGVDEDETI